MKYSSLLLIGILAACGAPPEDTNLDIGELEQPMISDDNFGIKVSDRTFCAPGMTGSCYYPPGWGDGSPALVDGVPYEWKVCLDFTNFDGSSADPNSQKVKASNAVAAVLSQITANGGWAHFVPCTGGSPNITIRATNLATVYGNGDIRAFTSMACSSDQVLSELPNLSGSDHRYCFSWLINIEADDIDSWFNVALEPDVYRHAMGATMGGGIVGAGMHTAGSSSIWTNVTIFPTGKSGFSPIEYCRAAARYDGNGNYFSVTKVDDGCD